jgi:PAS domain S-box-containing protein
MHKTLEEQLKKYFGSVTFAPEWKAFIEAIDATYKQLSQGNVLDSQQKIHLDEEASRLHASVNSLPIGLVMTDVSNKVLTLNKAAKNILLSRKDIQNQQLTEAVLTAEKPNIVLSQLQPFFEGLVDLSSQVTYCIKEGRVITVGALNFNKRILHISIQPISSNEEVGMSTIGAVIIMQDITEQKMIERSKDEFFSIASHELRTPLTAIRGNTSLIQQYYQDKLQDADLKEMINDIHASSIRLINIVNDFLNTSRLEMGRMKFKKEPVDLVALATDVIKEYLATGSQKKILIQLINPTTPLPKVIGDHDRIKQVLINLIGNSLKFTETGSITISFVLKSHEVVTKVTDTGKGIPAENQALLFRKFQQASASLFTRDDVQGTGLGLYISKMMMEGMGGSIWLVSSELGRGTTFAYSLAIAV